MSECASLETTEQRFALLLNHVSFYFDSKTRTSFDKRDERLWDAYKSVIKSFAPEALEPVGVTWRQVVAAYPDFGQWAVAKHGPLPEGPVEQVLYESLKSEYEGRR